jgi:DNA-binding SARP family transcriptional activator
VEFRILGPIEVVEGGLTMTLGGRKQRALLAVLLLHAGEVVSVDRLAEALWSDDPPRTAATAIQNFVSELRKLLGSGRLVTKSPGYALAIEGDELDADRARHLVAQAKTASPEEAVQLLATAESLWRGPTLADFTYDNFAQPAIAQLEELRLSIREDRLDAELELGRHVELIGELEAFVAEHPLRERGRAQLLLALYRAGRQADALHRYQEARRALAAELGLEPGPALQELHRQILRQERSLAPRSARTSPPDEIEQVTSALLAGRLVPVLGTEMRALTLRLGQLVDLPEDQDDGLTRVAQYVALMNGQGPLYDELHDLLAATVAPTPVHRFFASVTGLLRERGAPQQLVVTTAYDLALEQAFLDAGEEFDVVWYLATGPYRGKFCHLSPDGSTRVVEIANRYANGLDPEQRPVILKLHGGLDRSPERTWESFVVTEDDYIDYLVQGGLARAVPVALAARLRRSHFLFLGYTMSDWHLRLVLSRLWGGATVNYRSWAVADSAGPVERAFWRGRNIDVLETPVTEYVESLARQVGVGLETAP